MENFDKTLEGGQGEASEVEFFDEKVTHFLQIS